MQAIEPKLKSRIIQERWRAILTLDRRRCRVRMAVRIEDRAGKTPVKIRVN